MSEETKPEEIDQFDRDGGNAFPLEFVDTSDSEFDGMQIIDFGMSLRDYFAAKAMQSIIIAHPDYGRQPKSDELIATVSYHIADTMIKQKTKSKETHEK